MQNLQDLKAEKQAIFKKKVYDRREIGLQRRG